MQAAERLCPVTMSLLSAHPAGIARRQAFCLWRLPRTRVSTSAGTVMQHASLSRFRSIQLSNNGGP